MVRAALRRGNGGAAAAAAVGVFFQSFSCKYNVSKTLSQAPGQVLTNNYAEISAAVSLVEGCRLIARTSGIRQFTAFGDSTAVINTVTSGRIYNFRESSRLPNSTLWLRLKKELEMAKALGVWIHQIRSTSPVYRHST
jgi:ribonuclease HI